jgi:hypothetical protein
MSIIDALREVRHDNNNLEELAALPQALIMQMAQNGQIEKEMLMPILGKKAEIAEKTAKMKAAQQLAAQGGQAPTVMDSYMNTIAQAENPMPPMPPQQMMPPEMMAQQSMPQGPADVGIASNPVPPMQMAGGGIIAFADGGDIDEEDDYQEMQDDAEAAAMDNQIFEMISQLNEQNVSTVPQSADVEIDTVKPTEKAPKNMQGGIKALISEKAAKYNLPPELMQKIAGSESGGKANAANPNSSAKGVFQFIDSTWKGMGGKPGEQFDPEQNTELGAKYIRQNAEGLKDALGRNPTYGEIYAAHHFGLKGAKDLMSLDPRTPMESAVSGLVLQQNPQLRNRTVGQVMAELNKKTGNGVVSLAQGGEVQHYDVGGEIERVGGELDALRSATATMEEAIRSGGSRGGAIAPELRAGYENALKLRNERQAQYEALMEKTGAGKAAFNVQSSLNPVRPVANPVVAQAVQAGNAMNPDPRLVPAEAVPSTDAQMEADQGLGALKPAAQPEQQRPLTPAEEDQFNLMRYFKERQAKMDKAEKRDEAMAMLAGSLGILSGDSPYFGVNIGRGAQQGVQQLSASQKLRASQEAALGKLYGTASQQQMYNKYRQEALGAQGPAKYASELDKVRQARLTLEEKYLRQPKYMKLNSIDTYKTRLAENPNDTKAQKEYNNILDLEKDLRNRLRKELPDPDASLYGVKGGGTGVIKLN